MNKSLIVQNICLFLFLVLLSPIALYAQKVSVVDTLLVSDPKPFDKAFILKFPSNFKKTAHSGSLFEVSGKGCLKSPKGCFQFKDLWPFQKNNAVSIELNIVKQDTSGNLFLSFPPLQPDKEYFLIINYTVDTDPLDKMYDLIDKDDLTGAWILYNQLYNSTKRTFNTRFPNECHCGKANEFGIGSFDEQVALYCNEIKPIWNSVTANNSVKDSLIIAFTLDSAENTLVDNSFLKDLVKYRQNCLSCGDSLRELQQLKKDNTNFLAILFNLDKVDKRVTMGYISLNDVLKPVFIDSNTIKPDKQLANLSSSIDELSNIMILLKLINLENPLDHYDDGFHNLNRLLSVFNINFQRLSKLKKTIAKWDKDIADLLTKKSDILGTSEILWIPAFGSTADTHTYGFETRNSWIIKPDFGFMAYGNLGSSKNYWGFSPYLGFHINFRPLNSDIGFSTIRHKGVLGHLSFTSGVIISSFKEEGKRDGIVGNTSIFTGLGWAFAHSIRVNAGTVWYRKLDPNPLLNKKTPAATPYAGLSIDMRLRDIYDSFTKLFM